MLFSLEYIYALVRKIQSTHPNGDTRAFPQLVPCFLFAPLIDSLLRIVLGRQEYIHHRSDGVVGFWFRPDSTYYAAIAVAFVLSWNFFDRRRNELDDKFSWVVVPPSILARWIIVAIPMGLGIWLTYTGLFNKYLVPPLFVIIVAVSSWGLKKGLRK